MPRSGNGWLRLSGGTIRRAGVVLATIAVLAGVLLGAAAAAPGEGAAPAGPAARVGLLARLRRLAPSQPLHRLVAARLQGQSGVNTRQRARIFVGRYVRATEDGAIITSAKGQPVEVRVTPETRLPIRRPQPGDRVLIVGEATPGGPVQARAVFVRRAAAAARALL